MASSIFCRFPQAQGLLPELCKSEKGKKKKKSLIPTAIEGMIFLAGFGTPVGKALGVDNSEGAESHWYRFYSSFLVMLVHFFFCGGSGRVSPITAEPISHYIALSLSWHRRGFARHSAHVLSFQARFMAGRASPKYLGKG